MGAAARRVGRALGENPGSSKTSAGESVRAGLLILRWAFSLPLGRGVLAAPVGIVAAPGGIVSAQQPCKLLVAVGDTEANPSAFVTVSL